MADDADKIGKEILGEVEDMELGSSPEAREVQRMKAKDRLKSRGFSFTDMNASSLMLWMMIFHYGDVFVFHQTGVFRLFLYILVAFVFFPFAVFSSERGSGKVQACTMYWILLAVTFVLPFATSLPFVDRVPGLFTFMANFAGIIFIWFPPVPLYILFTQSNQLGNWGNKFLIGLIIFWIVAAFAGIGPMQNSPYFKNTFFSTLPTINIWGGMQSLPEKFGEGVDNIKDSFNKIDMGAWYDRQIRIATGDVYSGKVDENQQEKIGVFIEDLEASERLFYPDDEVKIWGILTAKSLDDKPIPVITACLADTTQGEMDPNEFEIENLEKHDLLCKIPPGTFKEDSDKTIKVYAKFNFSTLAYIKNYFMDKERERSLVQDGVDPFDEYQITDKSPMATYTNGPVMVGMKTTEPLIGLSRGENRAFKLGVTITNKWLGQVININSFVLQLPNTMSIVPDSCDKAILVGDSQTNPLSREYSEEGYVTYHMDETALGNITSFNSFETINCRVQIEDVDGTLGNTPISTKYFRTLVSYEYELEDSISINMEFPAKE